MPPPLIGSLCFQVAVSECMGACSAWVCPGMCLEKFVNVLSYRPVDKISPNFDVVQATDELIRFWRLRSQGQGRYKVRCEKLQDHLISWLAWRIPTKFEVNVYIFEVKYLRSYCGEQRHPHQHFDHLVSFMMLSMVLSVYWCKTVRQKEVS